MKLVVGNQKTYMLKQDVSRFITNMKKIKCSNVVICPSIIYMDKYKELKTILGAQNVSTETSSANTGEITSSQLASMNVSYCIVGHSERRTKFNETIFDTNIKIKNLLEKDIKPILCVGETITEYGSSLTKNVIENEIDGALKDISKALLSNVVIAYEPIWAIGTGQTPIMQEIDDIISFIKSYLCDKYKTNNKVLYGGSVNSKNIKELNKIACVDGYLIGGASTKYSEFNKIIKCCK